MKAKRGRQPWDAQRRVAVWLGLLVPVVGLLAPLFTGGPLFTGEVTDASTYMTVVLLAGPAAISGAVSGSRFFSLYEGYAERLDPTRTLSAEDAAKGAEAAFSPLGDWLWGSLVAGLSGGAVLCVMVAMTQENDPLTAILFGIFIYLPLAFTVAMGWMIGALIGTGVSVFLSAAVGMLVGLRKQPSRRGRTTWALVAAFVPLIAIAAIGTAGVTADIPISTMDKLGYIAGFDVPGAGFVLGPVVLWVCRVFLWAAMALFLVLVAIGFPAYAERRRRRSLGLPPDPPLENDAPDAGSGHTLPDGFR